MAMAVGYVGVKAIIEKDGKILFLKAPGKKDMFWDFPGGRIDAEESLHEALIRELHEELPGIEDIRIGRLVHAWRVPGFPWDDKSLTLIFYAVQADTSKVNELSHEHDEMRWVNAATAFNEVQSWESAIKAYNSSKEV